MVSTIVLEVNRVFLHQPEEILTKLWSCLGVEDSNKIDDIMFHGKDWEAYIRGKLSEEAYWINKIKRLPINYQGNWTSLCRLFERTIWVDKEILAIAQFLKGKYKLFAVANAGPELERRMNHSGLTDCFDAVIPSYKIGMAKPDKPIFEYICDVTKASPVEILFVDPDTPHVHAAKEFGFKPYLYTTPQAFQRDFVYPDVQHKNSISR